jgi:glycosyltransferase involved in cell wall biosynthesis
MKSSWICCQLGAREHYAIPRSLHQAGYLTQLITDAWIPPNSALNSLPASVLRTLRDRYHPDLFNAAIQSFTPNLIRFELTHKFRQTSDWDWTIERNHWFQSQVICHLDRLIAQGKVTTRPTLFTYSYAALELLRYAKSKGWKTVLGQIDPGLMEEKIVVSEHAKYPQLAPHWQPVPSEYWASWQEECQLADQIIVNSAWSKQALQQVGISQHKIQIVPLVYSPPPASQSFQRTYPDRFSAERPLRVLFLGQIILRKGIAALLEAARLLQDQPIEFWLVGSVGIDRSQVNLPNVRWVGSVPRSETARYYQRADIFLFPTLSDGFGLTQLEAQAWKLPIVASDRCGETVRDGVNGRVLAEVTGAAIADVLRGGVNQPEQWAAMALRSTLGDGDGLVQLSKRLQEMPYFLQGSY